MVAHRCCLGRGFFRMPRVPPGGKAIRNKRICRLFLHKFPQVGLSQFGMYHVPHSSKRERAQEPHTKLIRTALPFGSATESLSHPLCKYHLPSFVPSTLTHHSSPTTL